MPEIWKKLTLSPELCYFGPCRNDCLREMDRLAVFAQSKELKKPFWNRCSQGCRIISVTFKSVQLLYLYVRRECCSCSCMALAIPLVVPQSEQQIGSYVGVK